MKPARIFTRSRRAAWAALPLLAAALTAGCSSLPALFSPPPVPVSSVSAPGQGRRSLAEDERRAVFFQLTQAEDKAEDEAQFLYPGSDSYLTSDARRGRQAVKQEILQTYARRIGTEDALSPAQIAVIVHEGRARQWYPAP